ncbi:hypothetical protein ACXYMO_00505 [Arenibacterium sp. CAU 1754]
MNANQIINMILRIVMRKAISGGVNAGINAASNLGRKKRQNAPPPQIGDTDTAHSDRPAPLTPEEDARRRQERRAIRQARRAAKAAGRTGKM